MNVTRAAILTSVIVVTLWTASDVWATQVDTPPNGLAGPVIGYVFDGNARTVRPINGIPGSSSLGDSLALPFPVAAASFSPRANFGVVSEDLPDGHVYVLQNLGGALRIDTIEATIGGVDRIVLSADATVAALLSRSGRQLQILRGLPDSPVAGPPLDLSSLSGTITAIGINRTGSDIAIATTGDYGALYLASPDPQIAPHLIGNFGSPSALVFVNNDQDIVVADAALNELTLIRDVGGHAESFWIAGERDGISAPNGLGISVDGHKLFIADAGSRTVDVWDFATQTIEASFPLDGAPTRLIPLQGFSIYLLNEPGDHPLLLLRDAGGERATYFVPGAGER